MNLNYKSIVLLRIFKSIIGVFVNTFFILYFLTISNDNILPLGIYYLIVYTVIFVTIFMVRNLCKSKYRVNLLRVGIALNFMFFVLIYLLRENILNFIPLIAIIYGLQEGFYYSVYNNFESNGVNNKQRAKFIGSMTAINAILGFSIPLVFGSIMSIQGFEYCLIVVLVLSVLQLICSALYKDVVNIENKKCNLKEYFNVVKASESLKKLYTTIFFNGIIYSGAFSLIVTVYIIRVLVDSLSLGIFTAIFALITSFVGILFAKYIKPQRYETSLKVACVLTIIGLILIAINCNFVTIIIFNLFQSYSKTIVVLINSNSALSISNIDYVKDKFKVEYFVFLEFAYFLGRFFSYILFILLAISISVLWTNIILGIFGIFIILLTWSLINLERIFVKEKMYTKE